VAGPAEGARKGLIDVPERRPARLLDQARIVVPVPEREGVAAAEDGVARRDGRHRLGVDAREVQPLADERIHVGRADVAPVDRVGSQRVDHHEDHVRAIGPLGREHRGRGRLEEPAAG
jgi:hypothetical protein